MRNIFFEFMPPAQTRCYNRPLLEKEKWIQSNKDWHLRFDLEKADQAAILQDLDALLAGQVDQRKVLDEKSRALLITVTVTVTGIIALLRFGRNETSLAILSSHLWMLIACLGGLLYLMLAALMCVACLDTESFAIPQPVLPLDNIGGEFEYHVLDIGNRVQFQAEVYARNNLVLMRRNNLLMGTLHCLRNGLVLLLVCVIVLAGYSMRIEQRANLGPNHKVQFK